MDNFSFICMYIFNIILSGSSFLIRGLAIKSWYGGGLAIESWHGVAFGWKRFTLKKRPFRANINKLNPKINTQQRIKN